jgi:2-polyprenyl-6-hydroxyphenyl methylase/3-demethylubiquinone-9 3-methyltransferase
MTVDQHNIDDVEIAKFDALASRWWDPTGEFQPLHEINPLRLDYIRQLTTLKDSKVIDIGCGGGILAESMAINGAKVTGIDMAEESLAVARLHQVESGTSVNYQKSTAESFANEYENAFDVVTCLEMLEHVPEPMKVVASCAKLVKPGGDVFFSTINRNPKSFLFAIIGAEYLLNLIPVGTHEYKKFIRPSELETWARQAKLELNDSIGLHYNPLIREYSLGDDLDVNYLMHFQCPDNN